MHQSIWYSRFWYLLASMHTSFEKNTMLRLLSYVFVVASMGWDHCFAKHILSPFLSIEMYCDWRINELGSILSKIGVPTLLKWPIQNDTLTMKILPDMCLYILSIIYIYLALMPWTEWAQVTRWLVCGSFAVAWKFMVIKHYILYDVWIRIPKINDIHHFPSCRSALDWAVVVCVCACITYPIQKK